jgi:PAS domain S-box-containing protein
MGSGRYLPEQVRSRYAVKLFVVSLLIIATIIAGGTVIASQVSDRVTDAQLQSVEASAELEAESLASWFEGVQESIRVLSAHRGVVPSNRTTTEETLATELEQTSDELASLHVVERASQQPSNGTTERIVASTDGLAGEELAATNVDWGEDANGNPVAFAFDGTEDVLVSWVYLDDGEMSVAIASPTHSGDHVLIGEYHPSTRVAESADVVEGSDTVVLGGVSAFVMFEEDSPNEFRPYKGQQNATEVGSRILDRENQFAPLNGSELDETEVRGYHSVPSEGVNWVVVKEVPRSNALAITSQVQSDLAWLIGLTFVGFLLLGGMIQYGPIRSIKRLARQADAIATGDLTVEIEDDDRIDEVGQLRTNLQKTKSYVETITEQSEKLARQEFDDDVLAEDIPGPVGEAMVQMREDLERFITQLEAERERYSTLVEQSNDGIVVIQNGSFTFANGRFVDLTGYDREQLSEMSLAELTPPGEDDSPTDDITSLAENPRTQRQVGIETSSGERRTVELSAAAIEQGDEPAVLVNVRDITDRKRREQRLEIFNRVLRHNLRNDLDVVSSVLELAAMDADDLTPDAVQRARDRVAEIRETADKARRIERAVENIEVGYYDIAEILEPLESRANDDYPAATIDSAETTATVEVANVFGNAVWELLKNACEHAGPSPHVDLAVERRGEVAVLSISDDGPGLPAVERQTIESGEETDLQHATGLGLWFAYWVVEASGGDLSFEVDDGTTVLVTLPIAEDD